MSRRRIINVTTFLSIRETARRVGYCEKHLRRLSKAGRFPKLVRFGDNRVALVDAEVDEWQAARIAARDKQD